MKRNRIKLHLQLTIIGTLATVGLIFLMGEPAEDANFLATILIQLLVGLSSWGFAVYLFKKWDISDKL